MEAARDKSDCGDWYSCEAMERSIYRSGRFMTLYRDSLDKRPARIPFISSQ